MAGLIWTWLVTAVSFLIIARLPIGVQIDGFGKAFISAAVFGILNAILLPILTFFTFPFIIVTLGLFFFVLNAIIFALAAYLVPGFTLKWGIWSALIGSIALAIINSILLRLVAPIA
jgi:putative membrane protein